MLDMAQKRKTGRPLVDPTGRGRQVSTRLSDDTYRKLCALARKMEQDVSVLIREAIRIRLIYERRSSR